MSNSIFPASPKGLAWDVKKTPNFSVIKQTPANLKNEVRVAVTNQPQYKFEISYEFLRQDPNRGLAELDIIEGFFKARGGSFDSFLLDLSTLTGATADHTVTSQPVSPAADGTTTQFELYRSAGIFREVVDAVDGSTFKVYLNGVLQTSGYTLNAPYGWVTFTVAPSPGTTITWDGDFYYRVRFAEDLAEFNLMQTKLWEAQTITMLQVTT